MLQTHTHTYTHIDTSTDNKGRLKLAAREPIFILLLLQRFT